ncbi:MAG: outer membrane beta-barrel protein [Candidatus Aminicenantes bacterium]|nr:outer membrane beta-barrel protein [Candidatus Aminicenantes bacterium]NIM77630.1 outer membrane beta-barrel protein [Candidatus Aminicenantes bacterium]NIN16942.1 outer membrane beta-barrel protein [Candidatus Aminicenantes bacterium]NIN40835.1 outer membrane beta-barrel protein [Candidatus Aminicenantes bacterium]NIN83639.1 outer membrane beta-barrel protein [Candidatus Aminicenantes bacterium]
MKKMKPLLFLLILLAFVSINTWGDVKVYLDPGYSTDGTDVELTMDSLMDPNFPGPKNNLPVLFVHGHNFAEGKNYKKNWQQSLNGLPCFRETLELEANAWLGIEPYYIDLEDYIDDNEKRNRSIQEDAEKIKEAVELVLLHQGDPGAQSKKVVIIAFSRGTISARYYLKTLWENQRRQLDFHPVSEFIAISPPNHGTNSAAIFIGESLALKQINNGFWKNCERQFSDPRSHDFIENLNGHDIEDTMAANYCGQIFEFEAPGARRNNEPLEKGILYVTLYARENRDTVGGGTPSDDCQGRVLAKNLSPYAENREVPGIDNDDAYPEIPGGINKLLVHRNTVHMPEVICKALYTAVHHQAPPDELRYNAAEESNWKSPPIIPGLQTPQQEAGTVLLFDMSGSMSWGHDGTWGVEENKQRINLAKRAAEPFIILASLYLNRKANLGIAGFPRFPWSLSEGCNGQLISPMTLITATSSEDAIRTINCLKGQGNTPLLNGIDTAVQMFGNEGRKAIIFLSDGYHNCPNIVNIEDKAVINRIKKLDDNGIVVYTIGFGEEVDVDHRLLRKLAEERREPLKGTFINVIDAGFDPDQPDQWDPGTALKATYKSIFTDAFGLEAAVDPMGVIKAGEKITPEVKVNKHDRKISFLLSWVTPQKERLSLTIKASDGKEVPGEETGVSVHGGETYTIITVGDGFLKQPGKVGSRAWVMEIDAPGLQEGEIENFQYSVIMDSAMKMKTGFDRTAYETGDVITLTAAVTEAGHAKTGLTDVTVRITRPEDGPGNWYALNKVSAGELSSIPGKIDDENITRLYRKRVFLREKRQAKFPGRTRPVTLHLYDDGTHGDTRSGDGIYTNQYRDTIKEGTYCFQFRAASDNVDMFERETAVQKYVTVNADPGYSSLDIQWIDMDSGEGNQVQYFYDVTLVPGDRHGNYVGPGHTVAATVVYADEEHRNQSFRLEDNLDGTYKGNVKILRSGLDAGARLVFSIDGKPLTVVDKIPRFNRWAFGIYAGAGIPIDILNVNYDPGFSSGGYIGYYFSPSFSLVGLLGYNGFKAVSASAAGDMYWWNISCNIKSEILTRPFRLYVNAGPGIYIPKTGSLEQGFNVGAGVSYSLASRWALELGTDYHRIFTKGFDNTFFLTHARLIYRF